MPSLLLIVLESSEGGPGLNDSRFSKKDSRVPTGVVHDDNTTSLPYYCAGFVIRLAALYPSPCDSKQGKPCQRAWFNWEW